MPPHRVYVEPYGGGASVLLRKPRSYGEVYNDLDGEIVNLFRVLRDPVLSLELESAVRLTPFSREEFLDAFEPAGDDPVEQARRTLVKSHMGFGSDGITSTTGTMTTGFRGCAKRLRTAPAHDWGKWPSLAKAFTTRLSGVIVEHRDALVVMHQQDGPATLHYVDPPYPHETRGQNVTRTGDQKHARRYRHEMSDDAHRLLILELRDLAGMVMLSAYPCPVYDEPLCRAGWTRLTCSAFADGAKQRTEVLWLNPACVAAQSQRSLEFAE